MNAAAGSSRPSEHTRANARFALAVDPDNAALRARMPEVGRRRAAGLPTVPSTIGAEKATNRFLRAGDPAIRAQLGLERASDAEVFAELRARKDGVRPARQPVITPRRCRRDRPPSTFPRAG
jgi:hypothetical protein